VVALNTTNSSMPITLSLQNTGLSANATAVPYVTNSSNNTAQQSKLTASNGTFSSTITARTLITYQIS
jgi:glucuronoarabinoxylan endo-1,4-beta-xylanase